MIERHFKKIIVFLILLGLGYLTPIIRYETLLSGFKFLNGKINTAVGPKNGYFVRDRWTNEIKWVDLK